MTTPTESPADLLRRAADRLAELDKAAPPAPWRAYGQWVAAPVDVCTCASPGGVYGHESGCGFEQIADTHPEAAALIVALRPAADLLASMMIAAADNIDRAGREPGLSERDRRLTARHAEIHYGRLCGYARAVLSETER